MRILALALLVLAACGTAYTAGGGASAPPELLAAQEALKQNLALGAALDGRSATSEQADEATQLVEDGLAKARAYATQQPRAAEAHHLIGLFLLFAYRPVKSGSASVTDSKTGQVSQTTLTVLRLGGKEACEEGLAELRTAARLDAGDVGIQLDYAEALQQCDQAKHSGNLLSALWQRRTGLTGAQRARAARLAAQAYRAQNQPGDEVRWLHEVLASDPKDEAARQRLAELAPASGSAIAWESYQVGMNQRRPVMMDFMAEWCGWCKKLDKEVYTDPEVLKVSRQFSCIKVDGDRNRELVRSYRVDGYPTIVFLDASGKEVHRVVGYRPAQAFLAEMQKALAANAPLPKSGGGRR